MARLPIPGKDSGTWGSILNDYLSQTHKSDGTLKDDSVGSVQLADNAVTNSAIAPDAITATEIQDGSILEAQLDSGVQTKLNTAAPTWSTLSGKPAVVAAGSSTSTARDAVDAVARRDRPKNILDYGVSIGTSASQTVAIKAALDTYPGEAFYFPPGDYRLDTGLVVASDNSLLFAAGARLYAGAVMSVLLRYDNGATGASSYTQDKRISGAGTLDAALLANTALQIASVIRLTVEGLTIVNPINRGIITDTLGAEIIARDLRIHNTGTTNVVDNIAIEANMGDCHFSDIITRDFTVGIWDKGGNVWNDVHPWIGTTTQLTARYPTSVGFIIGSHSTLSRPYADTYRVMFRTSSSGRTASVTTTNGSSTITAGSATFTAADVGSPITGSGIPANTRITVYTNNTNVTISANATASATITATIFGSSKVQITNPKAFTNTGNLTNALAAANPGTIFNLEDGARVVVQSGRYQGHGTTPHAWASGITSKLTATSPIDDVPGSVSGIAEFYRGVQVSEANIAGAINIAPTLYGHVQGLGSVVYTTRAGKMEIRDGMVTYTGRIVGTLGSDASGNYRIGNLPFPSGATVVSLGTGSLTRRAGISTAVGVYGANGTSGYLIAIIYDGDGNEVTVTPNQAFDIHFNITCPFTYPS